VFVETLIKELIKGCNKAINYISLEIRCNYI